MRVSALTRRLSGLGAETGGEQQDVMLWPRCQGGSSKSVSGLPRVVSSGPCSWEQAPGLRLETDLCSVQVEALVFSQVNDSWSLGLSWRGPVTTLAL